ncbi:peptidoglycan-binding domain-containing protein [Bartonella sp. CB175]|uniref:peptidoglycan-binding domain-containing protein n=1 Tax=Bartonella sp. CB175 TaxID=3112256 RepID=UPI00300DF8B9
MKKKPKTRKSKSAKRSKHYSIVIIFFLIIFRFIFWLVRHLYFYTRKNTSLVIGLIIFTLSFIFVSFNALFLQTEMRQDVFPPIKFTSISSIEQDLTLFPPRTKLQGNAHITPISTQNDLLKNSSSSSLSESTLKMQKKLAKLKFYDGSLDGVDEPKTRRAIWKKQTTNEKQNTTLSKPETDEIAILIKRSEREMAKDLAHSKTAVLKPRVADIVRVQKALRLFGNQEVIVTGVEDPKTIDALKQFQKMFHLPITGKIDQQILLKMREVGLLN